tara:strand:- start:45 stop:497 length:453 start_codon:yes stop_codon:yes gene_type:complete
MEIDSSGIVTKPYQPAFLYQGANGQNNIAINTENTILFTTGRFDNNNDFGSNVFTAPVNGRYQLNTHLRIDAWDAQATYYQLYLRTSNRTYYQTFAGPAASTDLNYFTMNLSILADMELGDTARVIIYQGNGTQQSDIHGESSFSGFLVC